MRAPIPPTHGSPNPKLDISQSYILMVQHLIERCLLLYMDREDCVKALAKYARVKPVITLTVWKELEKENKEFLLQAQNYARNVDSRLLNGLLLCSVWKELEKENKEFFSAYSKHRTTRHVRVFTKVLEEATTKLCAQTLECPPCETSLQPCPTPLTS